MTHTVAELIQSATQLVNAGKWDDAERIWIEVYRREPLNPQALFSLGVHAMRRGDRVSAADWLNQARQVAPREIGTLMALVRLSRDRGDPTAEREAFEAALALDPYFIPALLAKGSWLERLPDPVGAATTYRNVLKIAPPQDQWPHEYRAQLEHSRAVAQGYGDRYGRHLLEQTADLQASLHPLLAERWRECASIMAGQSQPYRSTCNQLLIPRIPAIPFFDRSVFPELQALEAKTTVIRDELVALLAGGRKGFAPYIAYRRGEPVNQWHELNHSLRWSAFHLYRSGLPVPENLARVPETARALAALPLAGIDGLCPNVMFSALAPHTQIPPHHGETNARVIAHLPLIVPEGCTYRVGFEHRKWQVGETLIFDDSLEHEARNDSDELRVVLIFDLWNPILSLAERQLVNRLVVKAREFNGY